MLAERIQDMEADLERIAGVHSARIREQEGEISEVHIVSDPTRRAKWIVRDAVTTLFVRHGVRIPHQRVSVASSAPLGAEAAVLEPALAGRPSVSSVHLVREGDSLRATVEVRDADRAVRASADALATRANRTRVVAVATLEAVRKLTGGTLLLDLDETRCVKLGGLPVVLARLAVMQGGVERTLIGSCQVEGDHSEAAAAAVLCAVSGLLQSLRDSADGVEYEVAEEERA